MTRKIFRIVFVLACLLGYSQSRAEFKDIKIDLTNAAYLSATESVQNAALSFGVAIADDGTPSRVDATDASAAIVLTGKFHSSEHGWGNFSSTVAVEGPVKISMGTCAWGGNVTIKNGDAVVGTFSSKKENSCYHNNKTENIASFIYKGDAATLTVSGGSYTPYIAVEAIDPSELVEDAVIEYSLGVLTNAGIAPASEKVEIGKTFTIPANQTIYQEGKTLVSWNDGSKNYEIGEVVTVEGNMTLTPVFVDNTVSLADRAEPVTLKWVFGQKAGAPTIAIEGASKPSAMLVAQAKIGTEVIDVKLDIDASSGKFNNNRGDEWAQTNGGTKFLVPSCKGAVITYGSYGNGTNCTIDGQSVSGASASFTSIVATDPVEMIVDGGYMSYVQVMLPVVESAGGASFENVAANIKWALGGRDEEVATINEEAQAAVQQSGVSFGSDLKVGSASYFDVSFTKLTPATSNAGAKPGVMVEYRIKSYAGVTFKPSSISFDAVKVGTDNATVSYSYVCDGVESTVVNVDANDLLRNNGKNSATAQLNHKIDIQAGECSEFAFRYYISSTANNKDQCIANVNIAGEFNGQVVAVTQYALGVNSNIEDAGVITVYPKADSYDEGTEVKLTAAKNFGYAFVNWTDASGKEVSAEPSFTYTVDADAEFTANFKALATYELSYEVEGANLYQVQPSPAGTMVDGRRMYEEGTTVTLTASSNPIVTFTNWADGSTFAENRITMDSDKSVTAIYSAIDYIVGWDFYLAGGSGRPADYASTVENVSSALVLRDAEGNTTGWLDKSTVAAGGYESLAGAAVNWTTGIGHYYYQTKINARDFSNIRVSATMLYNYKAYTTQVCEYSLDGETWKEAGRISMPSNKVQYDLVATLPTEADHAESLFLRWRPDTDSPIDGSDSEKDGTAIANIYVTADADIYDDGTAPVIVSTVPAADADNASSTGRIVLNFDEKIKLTPNAKATLGGEPIELAVSGKTITANYRNLTYATPYEFVLAGGSVCDAAGNTLTEAVKISFTTMTRPEIAKNLYDAEVSNGEEFLAALAAANSRSDAGTRYRIFLYNGTYDLGKQTLTAISANNISLIGESEDGVVIVNKPEVEGIGVTATLFNTSTGLYMQDITLKNDYPYAQTTGRAVCLQDKGNKTVAKRVKLLSHQDTYYSNNSASRFYWEDSEIHGDVDFLCGGGDVVYNRVNIVLEKRSGNVIAAPNGQLKYGYVFHDCEINSVAGAESVVNGSYRLGRPWGAECRAQYINTKMNVLPAADGWAEMGGNKPAVFAEYNSVDKNGSVVDLSSRKVKFDGGTQLSAKLTDAQVEELSIENVMSGSDEWNPLTLTEQAPAPTNVKLDGSVLSWDDSNYVSLWAVCKDGKVVAFTTEPTYDVEAGRAAAVYSVRAANEMGGLGEAVEAGSQSAIEDINADSEVVSTVYYNLQGIRVSANTPGVLVKVDTLASGKTVTTKVTNRGR